MMREQDSGNLNYCCYYYYYHHHYYWTKYRTTEETGYDKKTECLVTACFWFDLLLLSF